MLVIIGSGYGLCYVKGYGYVKGASTMALILQDNWFTRGVFQLTASISVMKLNANIFLCVLE